MLAWGGLDYALSLAIGALYVVRALRVASVDVLRYDPPAALAYGPAALAYGANFHSNHPLGNRSDRDIRSIQL